MAKKIKIDKTCHMKGQGCRGHKRYWYSKELCDYLGIPNTHGIWACTHHWKEMCHDAGSRSEETD